MALKQVLDQTLQKPVTRKEFLTQVGVLLLTLVGVNSIIHALTGLGHKQTIGGRAESVRGYGDFAYGGKEIS